jgi:predicted nucleic acid-binding protein
LIVVSDTSPLLNLARIGRLDILEQLYKQVLIPSAVHEELLRFNTSLPAKVSPASFPWILAADAHDRARVSALRRDVDPGEAEAIVLASERHADLLLIDERRGRKIALAAGIKVTGLLGVIIAAKDAALIRHGKPVLDDLIHVARFWISPRLYADVLESLNEVDPIT